MNEYERREAIIERLARFCPIDGVELVTVKRKFEIRTRGGTLIASRTLDVKECPNGHGNMGVGPAAGDMAPQAIFELSETLFDEGAE